MTSSGAERRRLMRIQLEAPISAKVSTSRVVLVDISAEGARIEHNFPLSLGREVILHFEHGSRQVSIPCSVVRCKYERHDDRISYFSGLRFHDPGDGTLDTLQNIIAGAVGADLEARQYFLKIKR